MLLLSYHHFKTKVYQRGNSFWRTSRLRESHASNISFRDAQLPNKIGLDKNAVNETANT